MQLCSEPLETCDEIMRICQYLKQLQMWNRTCVIQKPEESKLLAARDFGEAIEKFVCVAADFQWFGDVI
jgi:hypothetical protein